MKQKIMHMCAKLIKDLHEYFFSIGRFRNHNAAFQWKRNKKSKPLLQKFSYWYVQVLLNRKNYSRDQAEAKIALHILKRTEQEMRKLYRAFASKSRKSFIKCYIRCDTKNCKPI